MTDSKPTAGHNSGVSSERLKSIIDRIEKLVSQKESIQSDISDVYAEAKGTGFDAPIIRKIIRERKMDVEKRREQEELLELYKAAIGME